MTQTLAFTADVTSRLTGLSEDQLRRWDGDGFFQPTFADPNRRRPYSRIYSFQDLVALRTIARLRQLGVPRKRLTGVAALLKGRPDASEHESRFFITARQVFDIPQEARIAAHQHGQHTPQEIVEVDVQAIAQEMQRRVSDLRKRDPQDIGRVHRERYIMDGQPVIAGTRIPTATIVEFVRRGYNDEEIIREFPRLTPADIKAAVREEEARHPLQRAS